MKQIIKYSALVFLTAVLFYISCKKETSCEGCREKNKPPIANAGPDQTITLPTDSVSLDGTSSSDQDGIISEWLWTKISGPASFNIIKPADSITKVKALVAGTYLFELKVTDNRGLSAKDTMQVIVNDPSQSNRPPIAKAGADQTITLPTNTINLDGIGSTDPDNNIASYAWTKISGPSSFNIANSNIVQTQVTNFIEGIYRFELKVTDADGLFSKDTAQVTINPAAPPSQQEQLFANAGPDIIITLPLDSVYLDGTQSCNNCSANYQWTMISGPSQVFLSSYWNNQVMVASNLIPGNYFFKLEMNTGGIITADTMNILVINNPQELNTITFVGLIWHYVFLTNFGIMSSVHPNLFTYDADGYYQLLPCEEYLQLDVASPWLLIPATQSGIFYSGYYDSGIKSGITRFPVDPTWLGKKSNYKIKIF